MFRVFTFIILAVAVILLTKCDEYNPYRVNTANLVGVWAIDNSTYRRPDEEPITKRLTVYATHMEFCPGQGTYGTQGQWKTDGFWCEAKDGSGEIEAVKKISDEDIELHLAAFFPGNTEVLTLYKEEGDEAEQEAWAAKNSQPVSYPPPQGAITVGMTEYQLRMLPWKADQVTPTPNNNGFEQADDKADDAAIYRYHSDKPSLAELRVTVKNHRVIAVSGGNG